MDARFLLLLTTSIVTFSACSLILDRRADQCSTDGDCAKFAGTRCDSKVRLCVVLSDIDGGGPAPDGDAGSKGEDAATVPSSDAATDVALEAFVDPCLGPLGCFACTPTNDHQFQNGCTDAECRPFDNRARLKNLPPDGGLTPLPPPDAAPPPPDAPPSPTDAGAQ
jgi:hypothetical protein